MPQLIQPLPDGPLDIIGDVHGELEALQQLLHRLGVDVERRTSARPVVFVGDLVDRGPDSVGVVEVVQRLMDAGIAYAVAGNHELNLLQEEHKEGNGWFYGDASDAAQLKDRAVVLQSVQASDQNRPLLLEFFRRLPVVLRRDDVQVVHAAMDEDALALLPHAAELDTLTASFARRIEADLQATGQWDQAEAEKAEFAGLRQHAVEPTRHLAAVGEVGSRKQAGNPVKLLTSGPELPVAPTKHFFAGGKWRFVYRDPWWSRWQGRPTVVGHYWRRRAPLTQSLLLADFGHDRWCNKVFCIDYSVGVRFDERSLGKTAAFSHALAALRWPERVLQFDDTASPVPTLGF